MPIHVTQQLAGHADIKTTQKFYLSVQDDDLRAAPGAAADRQRAEHGCGQRTG